MKKILIIFLSVLVGNETYAQTPNWLWANEINGAPSNAAHENFATATDSVGNVFVTGAFTSPTITFGTITLINSGGTSVFIVKYDSFGNAIWAKNSVGNNMDGSTCVATDRSGNVFITGYFTSSNITFGTVTLVNSSSANIFIVKYDLNGNILWAKAAGGTGYAYSEANSISSDLNGNIIVTGYFWGPSMIVGSNILLNADTSSTGLYPDLFIVKLDPTGNVLWAKRAGGSDSDYGYSVTSDFSGNILLTGYYFSDTIVFDTLVLINYGSPNMFIVKYDPNGNVIWVRTATGIYGNESYSVGVDKMGSVFITGEFDGSTMTIGSITLFNSYVSSNFFIAKYDPNGNLLWAESSINSNGASVGNSVCVDTLGNAMATGLFLSQSINFGGITINKPIANYTTCSEPMFIVKFGPGGNVLCGSALADGGGEDPSNISIDINGDVILCSDFHVNPLIVGNDTLTTNNESIFVAKFRANCGFDGVNEISNDEIISVFPNPSSSIFNINCNEEIKMVIVNDLLGNEIYKINSDQKVIDLANFSSGIYFLNVQTEKGISVKKIIKE